MKLKKVLVTGATGFIGSCLCQRLLKESCDVHIVVRPNSNLAILDTIIDSVRVHIHDGSVMGMDRIVADVSPVVVIHLASLFITQHKPEDVERLIQSNILFGNQLLEAISRQGVPYLINTGTSWQNYQNNPYDPVNLYAASKQAFESIIQYYVAACGLSVITLRLFDTYGSGDTRPKLLNLLSRSNPGEKIGLSPGDQLLDILHVDDVVNAYIVAAKRFFRNPERRMETFDVRSNLNISLKDLVFMLEKVLRRQLLVEFGKRPYRKREVMVPPNYWPVLPGWKPKIAIEDGINRVFGK